MRVDVGRIKGERGGSMELRSSARVPTPWEEEGRLLGPVQVAVRVTNTGSCYLVRGKVTGKAILTCHRCLEPFEADLESELEEEFYPENGDDYGLAAETSHAREAGPDDEERNTFSGESFDLSEIIAEHGVMLLPAKAVCKEDCQGLCPMCGRNRNRERCACRPDDGDPRLAVLKELLPPDE